ncbi:MAG: type II toxin-antitoxin system RelE/ParE family toxin, partial [Nitrosopumilaceae archaeon]
MVWKIKWTDTSLNQLKKLHNQIQKRIFKKLDEIVDNPFDFVERLVGQNLYKLRVGDYRVLLTLEQNKMLILIVKVGHRKKIYD